MKIITAPHPGLRTTAKPITHVDTKLWKFLQNLGQTLSKTGKGIGLAAPQVDKAWRVFATYYSPDEETKPEQASLYINPRIVAHSNTVSLGNEHNEEEATQIEGCLSIPDVYGPVPRYAWVKIEYEKPEGDRLVSNAERFEAFHARLIQHEIDHLDGILFTDYSLKYDLPLYAGTRGGKLKEITQRDPFAAF